MARPISRKRPWLAALLGTLATGLGHLYLRRWLRAVGWLAALFGVTALFVDPAAIEAYANGNAVSVLSVAPALLVTACSAVDAYLLARVQNLIAGSRATADRGRQSTAVDDSRPCPNCGQSLDPGLEFCHWCTTELNGVHVARESNDGDRAEP
ncbi:zinc ribbon domain-containing protein [Natronomonas salsuginis]|jgi:hypothetical protein|uniref:Zinc ribbon domain-containing protein n=1 Tax=Natronomonas salsuginis TaxID=2217661 RepID=A0A4U5JAA5_9EURY|nr:zinc ribbon domain-containing protein [Natronomonas salsuginis]TKR24437.1 zinc ribbon domain-containing protein [Natronomonas salsuginis]